MKNIIARHSSIQITEYEPGECEKIENTFSIFNRVNFSSTPLGIHYDEDTKILYLPRGIDLDYLERVCGKEPIIDSKNTPYRVFDQPLMLKYLPRDETQEKLLRFMIGTGEYRYTRKHSQQALTASGGTGKTYISIATISYFSIVSAVITYSVNWLNQWKGFFLQYTDIREREIKLVNSSVTINRFLKNPELANKYKIFLFTHNTLKSYADNNGWDKITKLFEILGIGLKFYDECHQNFTNTTMIDFYTNVYKTYYVTGTLNRSSEEEDRIFGLYFKNVARIELFDEDNDPHTEYIAIKYYSNPTAQQMSKCKNIYGLDRNAYANYVVRQDNFKRAMRVLLDLFVFKLYGKALFFIGTNDAIQYVYDWLIQEYPELNGDIGIYTSLTNGKNKKEQLEKKIILSTTKSCGLAMDIKGLRLSAIVAEPFKSTVLARQTLWRTRDANTFCIELVDMSFSQCRKFYYNKRQIIDKYSTEMSQSSFSNQELEYKSEAIINNRQEYYNNSFIINPVSIKQNPTQQVVSLVDNRQTQNVVSTISRYKKYKEFKKKE